MHGRLAQLASAHHLLFRTYADEVLSLSLSNFFTDFSKLNLEVHAIREDKWLHGVIMKRTLYALLLCWPFALRLSLEV